MPTRDSARALPRHSTAPNGHEEGHGSGIPAALGTRRARRTERAQLQACRSGIARSREQAAAIQCTDRAGCKRRGGMVGGTLEAGRADLSQPDFVPERHNALALRRHDRELQCNQTAAAPPQ